MTPAVLLWDFGDTLVDERWMLRLPPVDVGWDRSWSRVMAELADSWNTNGVQSPEVFARLADATGMSIAAVEAHARDCCQRLVFHPTAWKVATEHLAPQALVTVNPDLFADYILGAYELDNVFDAIVVSYSEGTSDKAQLCLIALERLGYSGDRSRALLIDNRLDLVRDWEAFGGAGYWFQNDSLFAEDLPALLGI